LAIESLTRQSLSTRMMSASAGSALLLRFRRRGGKEIIEGLRQYFERVDSQRSTASDEEADAILTDALRSTRSNYRPIR
jgi:hypothetical protein